MEDRKFHLGLDFIIHENGYTLGDYDVATDAYVTKVAKSSVELAQLFYEWAAERGKKLALLDERRSK